MTVPLLLGLLLFGAVAAGAGPAIPAAAKGKPGKPTHPVAVTTTTTKPSEPSSPQAVAVRSWLDAHGVVFTGLQADLNTVTAAGNKGSTTAVASACDQLAADVATIMGLPAIPDPKIQAQWASALRDFKKAASDCVRSLTLNNSRLSKQYKPEVRSGVAQAKDVVSELKKLR
jgi:hypothetical protein